MNALIKGTNLFLRAARAALFESKPSPPPLPTFTPEERRLSDAFANYFYTLRVDEFLNPSFKGRCDRAAHEFNDSLYEYIKMREREELNARAKGE